MMGHKRKRISNTSAIQGINAEVETTMVANSNKAAIKVVRAFPGATGFKIYACRDPGALPCNDVLDLFATSINSLASILGIFSGADEYRVTIYGSHEAIRHGWNIINPVDNGSQVQHTAYSSQNNSHENNDASNNNDLDNDTNRNGNHVAVEGSKEPPRKRAKVTKGHGVKHEHHLEI